jgi:4-amino-4-deoxy-L-arabinose transferase-like glycosyltransferase
MSGSIRMRIGALLRWLILALLWFGPLNTPHLFEPDEGRYAEIPREMVASGDWVTPRLDGIKYFEKPALQYWATAAAFTVFGQHAWTARLWSALSAYLGLLLTFALARRLYDVRTAQLAVIVQASSLLYIGLARITTLDMSLCFSLQLALYALALLAQQRAAVPRAKVQGAANADESPLSSASTAGRQLPLLLGIGIALAVLSKGLVGILIPVAVAGIYFLWRRDWSLPLRARPWWGLLALLVLAAPWFLLVSQRNPEFAHFFFVVQHFQRYLSTAGFDRYQPAWFFIPVLLLGVLPWTTLLPGALQRAWLASRDGENGTALLLVWTVFVFVFFSLSHSKLIPYILPLLPAISVLLARYLASLPAPRFARHLSALALFGGVVAVALVVLWQVPAAAALAARASTGSIVGFAAAFLLLAAAAAAAAGLAQRNRPMAAAAIAGLGGWMLAQCLLLGAEQLPRMRDLVTLEQDVKPWIGNSTRLYCVNDYLQPLPFYWRRTCTLVGYRGELDFGLKQEPARWIPDLAQFERDWQSQDDALALLRPEDYRDLAALGLPMRVIYTSRSLVAVKR